MHEDKTYIGCRKHRPHRWLDETFAEAPVIIDERTMRLSGVELDRCTSTFHFDENYPQERLDFNEIGRKLWWLCLSFHGEYCKEYPRDGLRALEDLHNALHQEA